jgi:hypothetical protein
LPITDEIWEGTPPALSALYSCPRNVADTRRSGQIHDTTPLCMMFIVTSP